MPGQSKTGWWRASEVLERWKASTEYDALPKSDMLFDKHTKNTDETFIKTLIVFQKSLLHSISRNQEIFSHFSLLTPSGLLAK